MDPHVIRVSHDELHLAGLAEVAELLGVSKRSASRYTTRKDFPQPIARLAAGPIWHAAEIEAWAELNGPFRAGRPSSRG